MGQRQLVHETWGDGPVGKVKKDLVLGVLTMERTMCLGYGEQWISLKTRMLREVQLITSVLMPPFPWAHVSGLQAIWSRFFPAMEALREVLVQGTIGDLRVARAEFGFDLSHIPRATDWNQAGGGLLDLGIYCVQFLSMIFGAQKPEKISAVGRIHETGTS